MFAGNSLDSGGSTAHTDGLQYRDFCRDQHAEPDTHDDADAYEQRHAITDVHAEPVGDADSFGHPDSYGNAHPDPHVDGNADS